MEHDGNGICNEPIQNLEPSLVLFVELRFNKSIPLVFPSEFPQYLNVFWQRSEERLQKSADHVCSVNDMGTETDDDGLSSI